MLNKHSQFMKLAIDKAWKYQFLTYPNPAVGAVIVKDDKVLSVEAHYKAGESHAEVNALKSAFLVKYPNSPLKNCNSSVDIHNYLIKYHNNFFHDCDIYVTLEPCNHIGKTPSCAILLKSIKIQKVYIGTLDFNKTAFGGMKRLKDANIEVENNISLDETNELLLPFIQWQNDKFIFFKLAMRLDGTIEDGYITTKDSLKLVHNFRTKLDLLIIGGKTVRVDKPTLDTRFSDVNNPPNILIYSNKNKFDKNIPLFNIQNRNVQISNKISLKDNDKFIMIEGGYKLLEELKEICNYIVLFISHKEKTKNIFDINTFGYKKVYSYKINQYDELIFLKKVII